MPVATNQKHPGSFITLDAAETSPTIPGITVMVLGTKVAGGTATADEPVLLLTEPDIDALFGAGGPLARMAKRVIRAAPNVELRGLPVAEAGGGVAASDGFFNIVGTATAAGSMFAYVGDERYEVPIAIGDTGADVVDTLDLVIADAIAANTTYVASTIDDGISKLTLTYNFKGATGNQILLAWNRGESEQAVAGLTPTVSQPTNGATDPAITTALANVGDIKVDILVTQFNADAYLDELESFMSSRNDATIQNAGLVMFGIVDTVTNIVTEFDTNRNSEFSAGIGSAVVYTPAFEFAAIAWGEVANLSNADRNTTLRNIALTDLGVMATGDIFSEREALLQAGCSAIIVQSGAALLLRAVTTRTLTNGQPDNSWQQVEKRFVMYGTRVYVNSNFDVNWSQAKLSAAGVTNLPPNIRIMTPDLFRGIMANLYQELIDLGWLDPDSLPTFNDSLVAQINQPGRLDWSGTFAWLSGLFILDGTATFTSGT